MKKLPLVPALMVAMLLPLSGAAADAAEQDLGTPLTESTFSGALTAGPDGNVWFSAKDDGGEDKRVIGKITEGGKPTEYEVPAGAESIATGADGNVWFAEADGVGKITPQGQVTSFNLPAGKGEPTALTAGPDGNVWFVTKEPSAVGRITPAGAVTMYPLSGAGQPNSIAAGPVGELWFTQPDAARIGRITATGEESEFPLPDPSARPGSIALGADGNLWFSDGSSARLGRITPSGVVTFFPVPTLEGTEEVIASPGGEIWFTARNEIGRISTAGKVSWPGCFTRGCEYPPAAMTIGPDGRLWVASGEGHCPGYCGGGSELLYIFGSSSIGPYASLPSVTVGIGPTLSPVRNGRTNVVIGCGEAAPCSGTLRLRALVRLPKPKRLFATRQLSKLPYSLVAGEIKEVALRFPVRRWNHLVGNRRFVIVDARQGGRRVAKRGFYFNLPEKGGVEKHW
jgi:streptogramin lyase